LFTVSIVFYVKTTCSRLVGSTKLITHLHISLWTVTCCSRAHVCRFDNVLFYSVLFFFSVHFFYDIFYRRYYIGTYVRTTFSLPVALRRERKPRSSAVIRCNCDRGKTTVKAKNKTISPVKKCTRCVSSPKCSFGNRSS